MSDDALPTVRDRIVAQLDASEIHGVVGTFRNGETSYLVISHSTDRDGVGPVLDLRTVVVDLGDETVRVTDNNLWVPRDSEVAGSLTSVLARTQADLNGSVPSDADPLCESASDDLDADDLLDREVADDYQPPETREWGFGEGPPPEIDNLDKRLRDAGIDTSERYNMLEFGDKAPFNHDLWASGDLAGNYGVYATADDALVLVDVDDPDALDADLPETFAVSSPHGPDDRAHHYFAVENLSEVEDEFGKWNFGPEWGEIRVSNQYVVGPGSQLDGCRKTECDGGCDRPDGGRYRIVRDTEIATVGADWLIDLLDASGVSR
jgi:hypothetical protein